MTTQETYYEYDYNISTHTPLAGRDEILQFRYCMSAISTHTPLAGRDYYGASSATGDYGFLLTRPLRDVTGLAYNKTTPVKFLLTRPLRDVTITAMAGVPAFTFLLTRPLRDVTSSSRMALRSVQFLLTRPLRDVTILLRINWTGRSNFYSHAPCGT